MRVATSARWAYGVPPLRERSDGALIGTNRMSRCQTIGNEWNAQDGSGAMGLWLQSLG
jgi:hypothetical protein